MMYLIVVHHVICHTSLSKEMVLLPLFLMTVPGVDGFLSISGWYGVRFSWRKVLALVGQMLYYACLFSGMSLVVEWCGWGHRFIAIGNAWYGVAYLALLMLSPLLNAGLDALAEKGKLKTFFWGLVSLYCVDFMSRSIGLGFSVNGFGSHTFMTFLGLYCLIGCVVRLRWLDALSIKRLIWISIGIWMLMAGSLGVCALAKRIGFGQLVSSWGGYNNPLVAVSAVFAFLVFSKMDKVPRLVARVAAFLGPSIFAVYLIHDASPVMKKVLVVEFVNWFSGLHSISIVWDWVVALSGGLGVFLVCVIMDLLLRRLPLALLPRFMEKSGTHLMLYFNGHSRSRLASSAHISAKIG